MRDKANSSSTGRKIKHDTSSTTSGIEVDGTGYSSKRIASGMGNRANGCPCVAVHLDRSYDVVNVEINGKHKDNGGHS